MSLIFPDELRFRDGGFHGGTRWFILTHYFRVVTSLGTCTIPTGFHTDGASIPRVFHNIIGPTGPGWFEAGVLHDYLYSRHSDEHFKTTRKQADDLFLEVMFNIGVPWYLRNTIWAAVRSAGWRSWKKR